MKAVAVILLRGAKMRWQRQEGGGSRCSWLHSWEQEPVPSLAQPSGLHWEEHCLLRCHPQDHVPLALWQLCLVFC